MEKYLYIALFAPIVGSLFASLFARKPKQLFVGIVTSGLLFTSWVASIILLMNVHGEHTVHVTMFDWIVSGGFDLKFGFMADQVSIIMMVQLQLFPR